MSDWGVTPAGFVRKPADQIKADLEADLRAQFGEGLTLTPESVLGQVVGLSTGWFSELWQLLEGVYSSRYPDSASGTSLVNVCSITGTVPLPPTRSTVSVNATGVAGAVVPVGTQLSVKGGAKFRTKSAATIAAAGSVAIDCEALDFGPLAAPAGSLSVIDTPIAGLNAVTNPLDARLGRGPESDPHLRGRREQELRAQGVGAVEAIRERMLEVPGVTTCVVFENVGDVVSADGLPPHSIEVLVEGGTDADVLAAVWKNKGDGIQTFGNHTGNLLDSQGRQQTLHFSRPVERPIFAAVILLPNRAYAGGGVGDAQVKQALVDFAYGRLPGFGGYQIGDDVIRSRLAGVVFDNVEGVQDTYSVRVGFADPPPNVTRLVIGPREVARFDTSRITVKVV